MEEDVGVKAPVTRLRRRLSVEQAEDVSSPATPTKKRGGRLAAKPQLDLIEENAQVSSPRKSTRKSAVKDLADAEEKPVTPARRSTRIKSNSSLVLETLTAHTTDSPRARRALRRNSQAGSDNEGPATPARQRRTRKDSASSVENQDPVKETKPLLQVPEMVITEEPESEVQVTANKTNSSPRAAAEDLSPNSARKSKRLSEKRNRRSGSYKSESETNVNSERNKSLNDSTKKEKSDTKPKSDLSNKSSENIEVTDKISQSNTSLLNSVHTESRVLVSDHNKSTSDLNPDNIKKKRKRTESWPSASIPAPNDSVVFSDNEYAKKKKGKAANSLTKNSNFDLNNIIIKVDDNLKNKKETTGIDLNSKRTSVRSITTDLENASDVIQPTQITKTGDDSSINKEKTSDKPEGNDIGRQMSMLFEDTPNNVQAIVYFEDSDSNSVNSDAANKVKQLYSEDQCVPVVKHDIVFEVKLSTKTSDISNVSKEVILTNQSTMENDFNDTNNSKKSIDRVNDSCEPMDVDETIPEDVLHKTQNSLLDSSTDRKVQSQNTFIEESNKSKRKSSSSISDPDTLDKSKNENKSTLILSQIKDVSTTSEIPFKSPKKVVSEIMSKSVITNTCTNNETIKANLSLNDLKGTPLRQKDMQKLNVQTSTPITALTTNKNINVSDKRKSDSKTPDLSKSIDESSDDNSDEASKPKSKYLDDEAEEASGDYESGDSRDEEERQYEEENEIIERGETLGSDDDVSNDTDYEKDSFVVSSDAEDNELLSGSGENLSMSDNELTMSKRSKQKFNERKSKEQRNASREMFESRHKLNSSEPKSPAPKTKSNRMRINSSLLESDEEIVVKPKKGNRLRLDSSTLGASMKIEDANISNEKANKSINNESSINEKEITVCIDITDAKDPLVVEFKKEPKTPQKDLNISVVQFTATQEIENVEVAESNSILNQTKTDPLQETMANGDSDSSESEEILQNYDSVLDELNKNKRLKLNNNNFSLNIGKKKNNTASEPIVDQLNLSNSKKLKKNQKEESQDVVDSKSKMAEQPQKKQDLDSEDESNSIDLQLLLSEDNCESEDENVDDRNNQQKEGGDGNMFMSLKNSTDKNTSQQNTSLNESIRKKKKRKSSINFNASSLNTEDAKKPEMNETIKKKNRKTSVTIETMEGLQDSDNPEMNTSTKKKNRKSSVTEPVEEHQDSDKPELNTSTKKKKSRNSSVTETVEERQDSEKPELNTSTKKKNIKSSVTEPVEEHQENTNDGEPELNESVKKKKKRKSSIVPQEDPDPEGDFFFFDTTGAVDSNKEGNGVIDNIPAPDLPTSGKKKKNKKKEKLHEDVTQNMITGNDDFFFFDTTGAVDSGKEGNAVTDNIPAPDLPTSGKKKKNKKKEILHENVTQNMITGNDDDDSDGAPVEVTYRSEKACDLDAASQNAEGQEVPESESGKKKSKKKKKKSAVLHQSAESIKAEVVSLNNSKKRKRKTSATQGNLSQDHQEITESATLNESLSTGSHKKKRKTSHNDEASAQNPTEANNILYGEKKSGKKKKNRELPLSFKNMTSEPETTLTVAKKNKKRKDRDEDNVSNKTKVSKDSSFQEVHLPPLPASILSQLDDTPSKKNKVISTSKFVVENARQKRAKPSNYLEESVYLDESSPLAKKVKPRMKKPKVLPFIPTASISDSGFTTNFKINKLSQNIQFVAEPTDIAFSKERYLQKDRIKRLGTYDLYKKQIHKRLSKF